MNKRIFVTLAAVIIIGTIYMIPNKAGSERYSKPRKLTSMSNLEYFAQQTREKRTETARERMEIVKQNLDPIMTTENMGILAPIATIFAHIIQFLNADYLDLMKQIMDLNNWTNKLYNLNTMYRRTADEKIKALEERISALEGTEY